MPQLPESIAFLVFLAAALFCGHIVQAVGSLLEPLYYWTWRSKPSEVLLEGRRGFRGFTPADGRRINGLIRARLAGARHGEEPSSSSMFSYAKALVNKRGFERIDVFNALYACHRGLLTCSLYLALAAGGAVAGVRVAGGTWSRPLWTAFIVALLLLCLFWYRAKQRGYYYAREVLQMAEQELNGV